MKIKLPLVSRKTYEKETNELVKDIRILESTRSAADRKVKDLKEKLATNKYFSESREQEQNQEIERLKLELDQRDKKIQGMKWCIQERDKEIENIKQDNFNMYKKLEMASEMQRQVKEKIDIAFKIDVIEKQITEHGAVRTITTNDIKKLLKGEDLVEIYTKLALMV